MTAVDLADPDTYNDGVPHAEFRRLRRDAPVSWQPETNGTGFWAVTKHADVVDVLKNPSTYSSFRGGVLITDPPPPFLAKLREGMLHRDPPDHTAMRRLVNNAFNPRRVAQLDTAIAEQARILVNRACEQRACDFAIDVAGEMPLFVICEILGVPREDRARLYALTERMLGAKAGDRETALRDGMAAAEEMRAYGAALGEAKRRQPADDLVTDLLTSEIEGRRLTDGEFQAFFMLLFNAGSDTTKSLLCFGLNLLLDRPALLSLLREEPARVPATIEEVLRYESPVIQFRRTATRDTTLRGQALKEGDKIVVFFPSANRDEEVFPNPDAFDIDRRTNEHVAFGYGAHYCLGAPLARIESKHLMLQALARMGRLERASPLVTMRTNFIRVVRSLKITYAPI